MATDYDEDQGDWQCEHCGARPADGPEVEPIEQEELHGVVGHELYRCPTCGAYEDFLG